MILFIAFLATISISLPEKILIEVPFTPQAPFGKWKNIYFQNGCEEAIVTMAIHWVQKKSLSLKEAEKEIKKLSLFSLKKLGHFHDQSLEDILKLFKGFHNYRNTEIVYDIKIEDIKRELLKGNLIIIPVNGRLLKNPYYTQPGPEYHMLLVKGFDDLTQEFIVNDPGTKRGYSYRYPYEILEKAIRVYETGYRVQVKSPKKAMIIVKPN